MAIEKRTRKHFQCQYTTTRVPSAIRPPHFFPRIYHAGALLGRMPCVSLFCVHGWRRPPPPCAVLSTVSFRCSPIAAPSSLPDGNRRTRRWEDMCQRRPNRSHRLDKCSIKVYFESGREGHISDHIRDNLLVELLSARAERTATDCAQVWRCSSNALAGAPGRALGRVMTCIGTREALHRDALRWCSFPAMLRVRLCFSRARRLDSGTSTGGGTGPEPATIPAMLSVRRATMRHRRRCK